MNISILKDYDRRIILVEGQEQRRLYLHDIEAIVYTNTNEISIYAKDTNALLYERLSNIDFDTPTGTALQIIDSLAIPYIADNGQATITNYTHLQNFDSMVWNVVHPLQRLNCHVTVIDPDNKIIPCADIELIDPTHLTITFSEPQQGRAYIS